MHPKAFDKIPNIDFSAVRMPIIIKYPHPGKIPESVKSSKLRSSENSRSAEATRLSKIGSNRYIFHDFVKYPMKCADDLRKEYPLHPYLRRCFSTIESAYYYIGGRDTGTILHRHQTAINILSSGKKRWLIFPHTEKNKYIVDKMKADWDTTKETSIVKWEEKYKKKLIKEAEYVFDFVQNKDELLLIPENCYHAVINLTDVRGIVFAFE